MKIRAVTNCNANFGRALDSKECIDGRKLQKEALEFLGCEDIMTIIPEASFPSARETFLGQGHINSAQTDSFLDFWKTYTASNNIKLLPVGEYYKGREKGFYCAYRTSSLTLGINSINLNDLVTPEFGGILSRSTLEKVIKNADYKGISNLANFENVCGDKSLQNEALKEAFGNFKSSSSERVTALKTEFANFKNEYKPFIQRRALFETLCDIYNSDNIDNWSELDKNLFNSKVINEQVRQNRIKELEQQYSDNIDFVYFKQFLAEKDLAKGREMLHKKGIKLTGDCPIGFSPDERWGFKDAFSGAYIHRVWGAEGLEYSQLRDNTSEASKLLDLRIKACAKRYDQLRIDCGWMFIRPKLVTNKRDIAENLRRNNYRIQMFEDGYDVWRLENVGDEFLKKIEASFKEVKKDKYNPHDLMYEVAASQDDYSPWLKNGVVDILQDRKIVISTQYMRKSYVCIDYLNQLKRDSYILMPGNHDHLALQSFANGVDTDDLIKSTKNDIAEMLSVQRKLLAQDLQLDENLLKNPSEFVKAKFAYIFSAKNVKMFFMDIFGRSEQFNSHYKNGAINFRYMIPADYEVQYHTALQNGRGFNVFDALAKMVKKKGGDKIKPKMYKKLLHYAELLYQKGVKTRYEADILSKARKSKMVALALSAATFTGALCLGINDYRKNNKKRQVLKV